MHSLAEAAQQALAALQGWDALSDYELTGTTEAKTALREADEAGRLALAALQRALAAGALEEMQSITESEYSDGERGRND